MTRYADRQTLHPAEHPSSHTTNFSIKARTRSISLQQPNCTCCKVRSKFYTCTSVYIIYVCIVSRIRLYVFTARADESERPDIIRIHYKYVSRKYQNFFFFNRPLFLVSFILQSVCTRTRGIKLYPVNHWTALSNSIWAPLSLVNSCSIPLSRFQHFFRRVCFFHSSFLSFHSSVQLFFLFTCTLLVGKR